MNPRICAFIIAFALLSGCVFSFSSPSVKIVSIKPNKTTYHSGNIMKLNIMLEASEDIQDVIIRVTGLKNALGKMLLNKSMMVDLIKGSNNELIKYKMPYCSPCMKLNPSVYPINITISHDNKILARGMVEIRLEK